MTVQAFILIPDLIYSDMVVTFGLNPSPNEQANGEASGIEVIQDAHGIQRLYNNLVRSAEHEILLFLPTTSAFLREEKIGIIQSLRNASLRGVRVKVLTPTDGQTDAKMQAIFHDKEGVIQFRRIRADLDSQTSQQARTKILIVDKKEYLIVELKDDSKQTFVDAVRLAVYSSTESTVKSYLTLIETLWKQAESYDQLEAYEKMQRDFINIAAHELRTPMQPILGALEMLKSNEIEREEALDLIARNAKRAERLATVILDVSRLENNSFRLNRSDLDLHATVADAVDEQRLIIEKEGKARSLKILFEDKTQESLSLHADKDRISEIVHNLLNNAVNHTESGTIKVTLETEGKKIICKVIDNGSGIRDDVQRKLFTKFMTTSAKGMGLGLFISKNIIEAHGGEIWATNNRDGSGATFAFSLPSNRIDKDERQ